VRVNSVQDAEDLTAQTIIAAFEGIHAYRDDGSVAAWLTIIARNYVVTHYRTRRPQDTLDLAEDVSAPTHSVEELVGLRLTLAAVRRALDSLTHEQAEVVRLRIFGELTTAETAQVMQRSEAAVRMLLHRALRNLRQTMHTYEEPS
jgi:RNA polymerase sigma-70 factor (ECF subfamily)